MVTITEDDLDFGEELNYWDNPDLWDPLPDELGFWDIYQGSKRVGDVLLAAVKLYNIGSDTVVREHEDGSKYIFINGADIHPDCVDEVVKRFADRAFPVPTAARRPDCPGIYSTDVLDYVHAVLLNEGGIPEGVRKRFESHLLKCDRCFSDMLEGYEATKNNYLDGGPR